MIDHVDITKTNLSALCGINLKVNLEYNLPVGSIVVETCDKNIDAYRLEENEKVRLCSGTYKDISSFIQDLAVIVS